MMRAVEAFDHAVHGLKPGLKQPEVGRTLTRA